MANTTISFDIENVLLAELATAIEVNLGRESEEIDAALIKRCVETDLMRVLNRKRLTDASEAVLEEVVTATSIFT